MSEFEDKLNSILNDPQQMGKIADMAKSLMGGEEQKESQPQNKGRDENPLSMFSSELGFDIGSAAKISRILTELKNEKDDKTALLKAMEPYLSDSRREKVEKGVKLAKLARIAKLAFGEPGGDGNV